MLENGRAKAAYDYCSKCDKSFLNEYRTRVMNMPFMIKTSGLAGAFAFLLSKKKPAYRQLYQDIMDWMIKKDLIREIVFDKGQGKRNDPELLAQLLEMDSLQYRKVTMETMALLNWMKRFCDSLYVLSNTDNIDKE